MDKLIIGAGPVSYTHIRAHENRAYLGFRHLVLNVGGGALVTGRRKNG